MTTQSPPKVIILKFLLIAIISATLAVSLFCDYREQQKVNLDRMRDELDFSELFKLETGDSVMPPSQLEKYLHYFQGVTKSDPTRADAQAMIGYCYFYLGDKTKAIDAYQKAVTLSPKVFWFHYNLATIALLDAKYELALEEFQNALATNPIENIVFLRKSPIFVYIIYKAKLINPSLGERLKNGYAMSAYYVAKCVEQLGGVKEAALYHQQMKAAGIPMPKEDIILRLKIF